MISKIWRYEGIKFLPQNIFSGLNVETNIILNGPYCGKKTEGGQEMIIP